MKESSEHVLVGRRLGVGTVLARESGEASPAGDGRDGLRTD